MENKNYKVEHLINDTWQVINADTGEVLYQGSMHDCQA